MKSVVLILPYFGKLPDIFPLFLKTAEKNPDIQFLIITDSKELVNSSKNITIVYQTFSEFKKLNIKIPSFLSFFVKTPTIELP